VPAPFSLSPQHCLAASTSCFFIRKTLAAPANGLPFLPKALALQLEILVPDAHGSEGVY